MISLSLIRLVTSPFSRWTARTRSTQSHCSLKLTVRFHQSFESKTINISSVSPKTRRSQETEKFACSMKSSSLATVRLNVLERHHQWSHSPTSLSISQGDSEPISSSTQNLLFSQQLFSSLTSPSKTDWSWSRTKQYHNVKEIS